MNQFKKLSILFSIGAVGYCALEIIWRGYTHWSMGVTGGMCFLSIFDINKKLKRKKLWQKCVLGAAVITGFEFIVGLIVNKIFHLHVWDYSAQYGNIFGQICPLYSCLWFLLCLPLCRFCRLVEKWLAHPTLRFFSRQIPIK